MEIGCRISRYRIQPDFIAIVEKRSGVGFDTSIRLHLYCVPAFLFPADACARTYCPCFSGGEPISVFVCLVCVGILVTHPLWRDIS